MPPPSDTPVLIVGAGPTGLVLALCLRRFGIPFRIIDQAEGPGTTSRALVVHARTLEFYRQLGIADTVVREGEKFASLAFWVRGRMRGTLEFGDTGKGLSRFPFSLIFPQDKHERVLAEELRRQGVEVEWKTELTGLTAAADSVEAVLRAPSGAEERRCFRYVAGCDGAHSAVRRSAGIGLPGGTYSHHWYVADVQADGPAINRGVNISMGETEVIAIFPMKGPGGARLVGQSPTPAEGSTLTWNDVSHLPLEEVKTRVTKVNWFSSYRVHHRVAQTFRRGRIFLLGDAAHLHSPVGGQGMNTGIGDAVNLAWKLASAVSGAPEGLIETYEPERIAFARRLVATTDRVFTILNSKSLPARFFRKVIVPGVFPVIFSTGAGRRFGFRLLSQIAIRYRGSRLSEGRAGQVHGGDRLPWVETSGSADGCPDNFTPLAAMTWQVHVYGEAPPPLRSACEAAGLRWHAFTWDPAMRRTGLARDAIYLVRPDGYVAFAGGAGDLSGLEAYLARWRPLTSWS